MRTAIWWIRRDLRLTDNQALFAALNDCERVLPVFILDPVLLESQYVGAKRLEFLFSCLLSLNNDLREHGSHLVVRRGNPARELERLVQETGAASVYAEADYTPYARRRDAKAAESVPLRLAGFPTVFPAGAIRKPDGKPYTMFAPFSKAWKKLPFPGSIIPAPNNIHTPNPLPGLDISVQQDTTLPVYFPASETEALARLEKFTVGENAGIYRYGEYRNLLEAAATSQLSPYLRFGLLSARQVALAANQAIQNARDSKSRENAEIWLNQLIWREFFTNISYNFPFVHRGSFRARYRNLKWENRLDDFDAWCSGMTGFPVVDAGMRQLQSTGWMHNRLRMIVASFLTKDLLIDWRWGEKWFMKHLVDGDPAQNNGGWQWVAGTGTDAAPYFRIFNPVTQSIKFDPDGGYIHEWVPELERVPVEFIHAPWKMPLDLQQKVGCRIGVDYPEPIVDHAWAHERVSSVFATAKERPLTIEQ